MPELMIGSEMVECTDHLTYLGSPTSPDGLVSDEISARIQTARLASTNLCQLWSRQDIHLPKERQEAPKPKRSARP